MSSRIPPGANSQTGPPYGDLAARHRLAATLGRSRPGSSSERLPEPPGEGQTLVAPRLRRRTGLWAAALLGAAAVLLVGWFWLRAATGAPEAVPLGDTSSAAVQQQNAGADAADPPMENDPGGNSPRVTIHVAGAVARPGVVELAVGSRLHDAIAAAGGATVAADPDRLNLAAVLEDGQKVFVPATGQPDVPAGEAGGPEGSGGGTASSGTVGGKVSLNAASVEELASLPRVGPVLAQRIVEWRREHGRFQRIEELDAVDGVGPKLLEALLPLVRI